MTAPKASTTAKPKASTFDLAVGFVLRDEIEGGYVNDPRDPGGETNFGISKRSYPSVNIRALTREGAIAIYRRDYWNAVRGDDLPPALAVCAFDAAVNQGPRPAITLLQKALGVTADGIIGPATLKAARDANPEAAMANYLSWRLHRYANTNNAAVYMRGWSKRVLLLATFVQRTFAAEGTA